MIISLDDECDLSYDELYDAFELLFNEFKTLGYKYSSLKKSHACLLVEKDALEKKKHALLLIMTMLANLKRKINL